MPVAPTEDVGVLAFQSLEEVVSRAAIERVLAHHAVDRVVAVGLRALQDPAHDLVEVEALAVLEDETLDLVGRDVVDVESGDKAR